MSKFDYKKMQDTAKRLIDRFSQGELVYIKPGEVTGPAFNPVIGPPTEHPCKGVVSGVAEHFIRDGYINASDYMARLSVFDVEPTTAGKLRVDGVERQIIEVKRMPAAGVVVAWLVILRG